MASSTVTDPFIQSFNIHQKWYLQTSPEYAMKRLLAAGSGSIYQICKAFRDDETGKLHNPEFTMLEWYRLGFDHHQLMQEMDDFFQAVIQTKPAEKISYQKLFEKYFQINPHQATLETLQNIAHEKQLIITSNNLTKDDWLQLLMTHFIEPELGRECPLFIYDFPASQAALAKIRQDHFPVAERFEVYIHGIELANGYHELSDANEQRQRFANDLIKRKKLNYATPPVDEYLLAAIEHGLPDCAGVALGIDRLIMIAAQKTAIAEVVSFTIDRV